MARILQILHINILTFPEFQYAFTNTFPEKGQKKYFESYADWLDQLQAEAATGQVSTAIGSGAATR